MGDVEGPLGGKHLLPAWRRHTDAETRSAVSGAVAVAIALQLSLPDSLTLAPRWVLPVVGGALLLALLVAPPIAPGADGRRARLLRGASLLLVAVVSLANAVSAARLVLHLVHGSATSEAPLLLRWGGAIWLTNVVVFAMWYWELDRGGPAARAHGHREHPDLLFPQMTSPELAPHDWEPRFLDYLYVAFTNATAFSPTDVLPLTRWAKMLMMLQSAVSISTLALVVARAINIL